MHMFIYIAHASETFVALRAFISLHSIVTLQVFLQKAFACKAVETVTTCERSLPCVSSDVSNQEALPNIALAAVHALVMLVVR